MSGSLLLTLTLLSASLVVFAFPRASERANEQCVANWLRTKPELRLRFQRSALVLLCNNTANWLQKATEPQVPGTSNDDIITRKQKRWLQNLRSCSGRDCLADAVASRCRGRRCLKQPRPAALPTPTDETSAGVAKDAPELSQPELETQFSLLKPRRIKDSDVVAAGDGNEIPANQLQRQYLTQGAESPNCKTKRTLSQLCPRVLAARKWQDVAPGLVDGRRQTSRKMARVYNGLRRKCNSIKNRLRRQGEADFAKLARCASPVQVNLAREATARACTRVLGASGAKDAFPSQSQRTRAERRAARRQYQRALTSCQALQSQLASTGASFDDWLRAGLDMDDSGGRRKPARRGGRRRPGAGAGQRLSHDAAGLDFDAPGLDFDDIDSVDFRAKRKEYRTSNQLFSFPSLRLICVIFRHDDNHRARGFPCGDEQAED